MTKECSFSAECALTRLTDPSHCEAGNTFAERFRQPDGTFKPFLDISDPTQPTREATNLAEQAQGTCVNEAQIAQETADFREFMFD